MKLPIDIDERKLYFFNIFKEIMWWIVSLFAVYIVFKPIISVIDYRYFVFNALIILIPIHYFRYILFFRKNILFKIRWMRFIVFALNIQLIIQIIRITQDILIVIEEQNIQEIMNSNIPSKMNLNDVFHLLYYIKEEVLGFAIASVLVAIALNLRIMYSFFGFGTKKMQNFVSSQST